MSSKPTSGPLGFSWFNFRFARYSPSVLPKLWEARFRKSAEEPPIGTPNRTSTHNEVCPQKGSLSSEMSQSKGNGILITFVRCSALGSKRESHIWVVGSRIGDAENHCRYRWPRVQPRGS